MKYYLIAGEASGDLHGANLIKEISLLDSDAQFRGWGGNKMANVGMTLVKHFKETSFMGFVEVAKNIGKINALFKLCKIDISTWQPEVVILIDYPGFNLRMAPFIKEKGIKLVYYISPQLWAWKENRISTIKQYVDELLVILPFEKDWYQERGVEAEFIGHPLLDELKNFKSKGGKKKTIALLPGSRWQEIKRMLPVMATMKEEFPDYTFTVAALSVHGNDWYNTLVDPEKINIVYDDTYQVLSDASYALVTSGTATLETALFKVPQIVCYKGNRLSFEIGRWLVKVPYISLVNLILDKESVTELIQDEFNEENLKLHLKHLVSNEPNRKRILKDYKALSKLLGENGASKKAAEIIVKVKS